MTEAKSQVTFDGSLEYCAQETLKYKKRGFDIASVERKRLWPLFWVFNYKVTLEKLVLLEITEAYDITSATSEVDNLKKELGI